MGYISKDIAVITEPKPLTLASLPNFVIFESKAKAPTLYQFKIEVKAGQADVDLTELRVTEPNGTVHIFTGTTDPEEVVGATFYVSTDPANTAENLRGALLQNSWIAANFDIRILFTWVGVVPSNGATLTIISKGSGEDYNIVITAPDNAANAAYILTPVNTHSTSGDSISGEAGTAEIEIDIYTDPVATLGREDTPTTTAQAGNFAIALQKTYAGAPLWFELNSLFQHYSGYNLPVVTGWFDTGSIRAYRFVAKKKAVDTFAFYVSSALFVLNGYGYASDSIDLNQYIYGGDYIFTLLSNKPVTTYMRGQKEYLNFIFSDPGGADFTLQVRYDAFNTLGDYLGQYFDQPVKRSQLHTVNTCALDIDALLDLYPAAGIVRVALSRGGNIVSTQLEYEVRPPCLHTLTPFVFLNRLGGWDAYNFDSEPVDEIKPEVDTYSKTITPYSKSIETVYATNLEDAVTIEGARVSDDVAAWLKELAAARVVLNGDGKYIVIEDFKIKDNVPTIKYHLSETYTND